MSNKRCAPYAIVGGVLARIIRDDNIDKLCEIKWWNKPESGLKIMLIYLTILSVF